MKTGWRPVVRPAVLVLLCAIVLGVLQGWLWSAIAPGVQVQVQVQANGDVQAFGIATASANAWVAIALYVLLGIVTGILLGVIAWRATSARGALMFGAVTVSALAGSAVAYWLGNLLAPGVDPATVTELTVITKVPAHYWLSMIVEPALAAATYTILAAWNGSPTLGRRDVTMVLAEPAARAAEQPGEPPAEDAESVVR